MHGKTFSPAYWEQVNFVRVPINHQPGYHIYPSLIICSCPLAVGKSTRVYVWICLLVEIYLWPQINTCLYFYGHLWTCEEQWKFDWLDRFPAEVEQGDSLLSCFSHNAINNSPFCGLSSAMCFEFLCLLLVIRCLKWWLSIVLKCCLMFSKCKKAVMWLREKIYMSGKLPWDMHYRVIDCEISVDESITH